MFGLIDSFGLQEAVLAGGISIDEGTQKSSKDAVTPVVMGSFEELANVIADQKKVPFICEFADDGKSVKEICFTISGTPYHLPENSDFTGSFRVVL